MLHIFESIKVKLQTLEAKAKAGVAHTEADVAALIAHVEDAAGFMRKPAPPAIVVQGAVGQHADTPAVATQTAEGSAPAP